MNRKRILAAIISVSILVLVALLLPSLHPALQPSSQVAQSAQPAPSATQTAAAPTTSAANVISTSVLASGATPHSPASQVTADLSDVDPHKAMGSKNAPIAMEVFSDFQCPACKALFLKVNQKLMDNYVITGKVYLIHRDFPLPCTPIRASRRVMRGPQRNSVKPSQWNKFYSRIRKSGNKTAMSMAPLPKLSLQVK